MSFTAANAKALAAAQTARCPRRYFDWRNMVKDGRQASFVGTAPMHFFYGLEAALAMLEEEGLENVFARHQRNADATRAAVGALGLPLFAEVPTNAVTAIAVPAGTIESSSGSATVAPAPRRNVRRANCFLAMNI